MPDPYIVPQEDTEARPPEWEDVEPGYGQRPTMRTVEWDPIHNDVRVSGPIIEVRPPERPA